MASKKIPALVSGAGNYTISSDDRSQRVSQAFEYKDDHRQQDDGRQLICHHQKRNRICENAFNLLSDLHFENKFDRLQTQSQKLIGPVCGNCGTRYLEHSEEFIFSGTHGRREPQKIKAMSISDTPSALQRKTWSEAIGFLDHQNQKNQHDTVRLLRALVNDASIVGSRRLLADPDAGVSWAYSRIFWLEKTLLAFERAKFTEWTAKQEASGDINHTRLADDDIVISFNWESREGRCLTGLHRKVSADIRSGYVFRLDANFDPRMDPVQFF